jgi:hypothetical protein
MAIDEEYLSTTDEGRQPDGIPSYMDMRTLNPSSFTPFGLSLELVCSQDNLVAGGLPIYPDLEWRLILFHSYLLRPNPRAD